MRATTIKIEGPLLSRVEEAKPADQSVSAYVRDVLDRELTRKQVREAAVEYQAFVEANPEEKVWLSDWSDADLTSPPATGDTGS